MVKQRNFNFRQTKSERSAEGAYSNFRQRLIKSLKLKNLKGIFPKSKGF